MKRYQFRVINDEIAGLIGEVATVPSDFIELKNTLGMHSVYYRLKDGRITDIIGEGQAEGTAKRRVEEFISALNVNIA